MERAPTFKIQRPLLALSIVLLGGVQGCSGSSCMPPDLLLLKVVDGETGEKLADAQVQVNGITLPFSDGDQWICASASRDCTHGIGHQIPLDFDRTRLAIVVVKDGYTTGVFEVVPERAGQTVYQMVTMWRVGSGDPTIEKGDYPLSLSEGCT